MFPCRLHVKGWMCKALITSPPMLQLVNLTLWKMETSRKGRRVLLARLWAVVAERPRKLCWTMKSARASWKSMAPYLWESPSNITPFSCCAGSYWRLRGKQVLQTSTLYLISWLLYIFVTLIQSYDLLSCDSSHDPFHSFTFTCDSLWVTPFIYDLPEYILTALVIVCFTFYYLWLTVIPYESLSLYLWLGWESLLLWLDTTILRTYY